MKRKLLSPVLNGPVAIFDEKSGFEFATEVIENGPNPIAEISKPMLLNEPTATLPNAMLDGVSVIPSGIYGRVKSICIVTDAVLLF